LLDTDKVVADPSRDENLSFTHHRYAMAAPADERPFWLAQASG
jgi:hypothetical protein